MNHDPGAVATVGAKASVEPLLKLRGIDKHFGPVQALYQVNLDLPAGQVTGLCGDNGAGKSV
ncbi:MAG TPA: sugar ABC transporter ATP-binding protein, partial [Candidatus Dormibacteraeota bacterium]